jgi:hypothetical protein
MDVVLKFKIDKMIDSDCALVVNLNRTPVNGFHSIKINYDVDVTA